MKRIRWTSAMLMTFVAGVAQAGTITQVVPYDFAFTETAFPTFDGFDDQGGTLQLDRLTFDWEMTWEIDYRIENTGPTSLAAGDFAATIEQFTVHQLGVGEGPPAYGPGGFFLSIENIALGAYDGSPGGGVDEYIDTFVESYDRLFEFTPSDGATYLDAVTQVGPLETVYGGFGGIGFAWINEPTGWDPPSGPFGTPIYPDDDAVWIHLDDTRHVGQFTVTYEFSVVPEPATFGLVCLAGLFVARRRRFR